MSGYGSLPDVGAPSRLVGAQGLKQACHAARLEGPSSRGPGVWGSWAMFPGPGLAKVHSSLGFQWILVDTEHGAIGDTEMHGMMPSIISSGVSPIVRVPAPEIAFVKRALDAGAHGIMFPMIETKEQAAAVVRMSKFPPVGNRGVGSPFAPAYFGQSMTAYQDSAADSTMVIVQIETPLGLENAYEIASTPGIDMLFIGPNDLACSLGNGSTPHMQVPAVQEAIETIRKEAERAGKLSGIFCVSAEQAADRYKQGFQMINIGGDIVAITLHLGGELAKAKSLTA